MNLAYARFEMRRLFRNRQNLIFALIVPVVLYFAIAAPQKDTNINGKGQAVLTFARFYLGGMLAFGAIAAVISGGARIAVERQVGWNRQLRLTPLRPRAYLRTKVVTSYVLALISIALVTASALSIGVRPDVPQYLTGIALVLVALVPFAALGIFFGHLIKGDSMGPVMGFCMSGFSILGGAYFPIGTGSGFMHDLVRVIPSFWIVQGGRYGIGGEHWTVEAWIVVVVWAAVCGTGAAWAYRRDTQRQV